LYSSIKSPLQCVENREKWKQIHKFSPIVGTLVLRTTIPNDNLHVFDWSLPPEDLYIADKQHKIRRAISYIIRKERETVQPEKDGPTILIIDPEQNISEIIQSGLRYDSLHVLSTSDEMEGMRLAQRIRPALIITELHLSFIDGIEVCRRLRNDQRTQDIPILVISSEKQSQNSILAAGANDYLARPFAFDDLLQHILALLPQEAVASLRILPSRYNPMRRTRRSILDFLEEWTDQALQDKLKLSD
jgi:CheY-like chemotaxis protein